MNWRKLSPARRLARRAGQRSGAVDMGDRWAIACHLCGDQVEGHKTDLADMVQVMDAALLVHMFSCHPEHAAPGVRLQPEHQAYLAERRARGR